MKSRNQRETTTGSIAAVSTTATALFGLIARADGILVYLVGIAATVTLIGAGLLLFSLVSAVPCENRSKIRLLRVVGIDKCVAPNREYII